MEIIISMSDQINTEEVVELYLANSWSSANKPTQLLSALRNSHTLVTGRYDGRLIGLGNAISDGYLVVYFPHMLVHPDFQRLGVGKLMMEQLLDKYKDFHQKMLTADGNAISFYESVGFCRAAKTEPMWIYSGTEH
jgi:GNAT superfamily N-acetyltransferase